MKDFVKEKLEDFLEEMSDDDVIAMWNNYCDNNRYEDDRIWYVSDFDDLMSGKLPSEVVEELSSSFSLNDEYMVFTMYGISSFSYVNDDVCPIYISDLADYILENDDELENDDVRDFLDEYAEEEEEDEEE